MHLRLNDFELEISTAGLVYLRLPRVCAFYAVLRSEKEPLDWWTEEDGVRRFTWRSVDVIFESPWSLRRQRLRQQVAELPAG